LFLPFFPLFSQIVAIFALDGGGRPVVLGIREYLSLSITKDLRYEGESLVIGAKLKDWPRQQRLSPMQREGSSWSGLMTIIMLSVARVWD